MWHEGYIKLDLLKTYKNDTNGQFMSFTSYLLYFKYTETHHTKN